MELISPAIDEDDLGDEETMPLDGEVATHDKEGNEAEAAGGSNHGEDPHV